MDLMRDQFMVQTGVRTNDLDMLICGWKVFLPMHSAMNKVNYARLALGTIIWTGITCKKIPCYMHDSACRWFIVKKAKIF